MQTRFLSAMIFEKQFWNHHWLSRFLLQYLKVHRIRKLPLVNLRIGYLFEFSIRISQIENYDCGVRIMIAGIAEAVRWGQSKVPQMERTAEPEFANLWVIR